MTPEQILQLLNMGVLGLLCYLLVMRVLVPEKTHKEVIDRVQATAVAAAAGGCKELSVKFEEALERAVLTAIEKAAEEGAETKLLRDAVADLMAQVEALKLESLKAGGRSRRGGI